MDNEANMSKASKMTTTPQKKNETERASPQVDVFNKYDKVLDVYAEEEK